MRELQKGVAQVNLATLEIHTVPCQIQKCPAASSRGNRQFDEQSDMRHGRGIHQRADFCAGKKLVYRLRFVRLFDVRGTRDQSLLFGPSEDHAEMSKLGMDSSVSNSSVPVAVRCARGNQQP